jgi:hypothetical protein
MAYDSRNIPLQDVQKDYYAGRYYLFDGIAGAVLFEIVQLEGRPHFHIYLAGGELAELVGVLLPRLESLATYRGCQSVIITGRRGWVRVLKPLGYSFKGKSQLGDWIVCKDLKPDTFEERIKPMTAINYSLSPTLVALATDTLVTDGRDWWPAFLTPKAAFIPHLEALITCNGMMSVMRDAFNYALSSVADNIEDLTAWLPAICRRSFGESLSLTRLMHPPTEDFSWADSRRNAARW